jgi:hypothetical protein
MRSRYGQQRTKVVESIQQLELDLGAGPGGFAATTETAKYLALWLCYAASLNLANVPLIVNNYSPSPGLVAPFTFTM